MNKEQHARLVSLLITMNATAVDAIQIKELIDGIAEDAYMSGMAAGRDICRDMMEEELQEVLDEYGAIHVNIFKN